MLSLSTFNDMNHKGKIIGQKRLSSDEEVVEFLKEFSETMEVAIEATPSTGLVTCPHICAFGKVFGVTFDYLYEKVEDINLVS